jgi:glycosyltransferase involved in cell wall biosynthesis
MSIPLVSIIIPTYNRVKIIQETLDSIVNQTYLNWECIIIDDGSTDATLDYINNYCKNDTRFNIFVRPDEKRKGPSSCRNFGIEKAAGEYVVFLDSDDLLATYCIEERVKAFSLYYECDFLVFQMERFMKVPIKHISKSLENLETKHCLSSFLQLNSIWQITSPIYKLDFLNRIKGFNEELKNYEDLEFSAKAIFNSSVYKLFNNIDSFYRNDENYSAKYNSKEVINKSIESFITVIKSLDKEVIAKCKSEELKTFYCQDIVSGYKRLFSLNIIENVTAYQNQNKVIVNFLSSHNYLTKKQYYVFFITQNILFKFQKIKGFGLFRFIKFLYERV